MADKRTAEAERSPEERLAEAMMPDVVDSTAVEESRPESTELVARPDIPEDVFRAMDALDERQILDELEGRPSDVMVYSFKSGGKLQTGLSWAGVAECVRTMNTEGWARIRVSKDVAPIWETVTEPDEETGEVVTYLQVQVYAEDEKNGGGQWGLARQRRMQTFRKEEGKPQRKPRLDTFAAAKALSKAQRNAELPLIPVAYREALIAIALKDEKKHREIRVSMGDATAELPPPLVDDEAKKLREQIRAEYARIRELAPTSLPPGQHNIKLQRAAHEHEALRELLAEYRSRVAHLEQQAGGEAA